MEELLFVYGTLKNHDVQKKVFGRMSKGFPDVLEGYKISSLKMEYNTYPIIVSDSKSSVEGLVISVTPKELKLIDEYETDAYRRMKVVLKSGKSAWTYQK